MSEMRIVRPRGPLLTPRRFVIAFGVLMILGLAWSTNWFGLASPRFAENAVYEFKYTAKSTVPSTDADGNEIRVPARLFVVDQTTNYPAAEENLVKDLTLPPNTFVWKRKVQPALELGDDTVREAYRYVEVRYHQANEEPQTIVPHLQRPK